MKSRKPVKVDKDCIRLDLEVMKEKFPYEVLYKGTLYVVVRDGNKVRMYEVA